MKHACCPSTWGLEVQVHSIVLSRVVVVGNPGINAILSINSSWKNLPSVVSCWQWSILSHTLQNGSPGPWEMACVPKVWLVLQHYSWEMWTKEDLLQERRKQWQTKVKIPMKSNLVNHWEVLGLFIEVWVRGTYRGSWSEPIQVTPPVW